MGGIFVVNMVSHLRNASRAKLGLTSVQHSKYNLAVALALHRAGFLAFVTRGGPFPPDLATLATYEPPPLTTANQAEQRLWLGLKYHHTSGTPVLGRIRAVSRPSRPVTVKLPGLERLARGFDAGWLRGLTLGEILIVGTPVGVLDIHEALQRRVGGIVICRAGP